MSLISHLKSPKRLNDPIRQYFESTFWNTRDLLAEDRKRMREALFARPSVGEDYRWDIIGMALDYRIRYYFEVTSHKDLVAYQGAGFLSGRRKEWAIEKLTDGSIVEQLSPIYQDFFNNLDSVTELYHPVGRRLSSDEEDELNRYCYALALMEEERRNPFSTNVLATGEFEDATALTDLAGQDSLDDLRTLSWKFYDGHSHLPTRPHVLNPIFEGSPDIGGADADLIVDDTLIDIKTTVKREIHPDWVWQLIGYVLLDYSDRYHINSIALYMARQGLLLQWDLQDALKVLSGGEALSLEQLRSHFKKLAKR